MRIRASRHDISGLRADLVVGFAYEGDKAPDGVGDPALKRRLAARMKAESFRGRAGDRVLWNAGSGSENRRFLVIGLGPRNGAPGSEVRTGCARATRAASDLAARTVAIRLPDGSSPETIEAAARAGTEGALLGAYFFDRYLNDPIRRPTRVEQIEMSADLPPARLRKTIAAGQVGARAVCLARDLVNEPPSRMTPERMAAVARREARRTGLRCTVLTGPQLRKAGMRALLAVSRGSAESPRVVHLVHRPSVRRRSARKVMLVGKGVTFDSGGLNLKLGNSMLTMKSDMAGAAAVLAAMTALSEANCPHEVHALLGLVENMTGSDAYKPGDILETLSGKTVEVGNTDAEGRLVLCDVLAYGASKVRPTHVVDVATLTGACVVALGEQAAGLFTRHDELGDELLAASAAAGEKIWPLPMYEEYLQLLQKGPADLRNVGGRWGGAITAALFLGEFLPRDLPWAHLDIAGPAFTETDLPEAPAGATGFGVMSLVRWLQGG